MKYTFDQSAARVREATTVMPGGVSSNFRLNVAPTPLVFDRGEGAYLYDIDGNRLIDYYLALGPMILGHSPAPVIEAARAQLERGILYGGQTEMEYEAAARIAAMVPCAERVRFASSGSEAVQLALRLARAATKRDKVVKFEGHYHGWMDNVLWSNAPGAEAAGPEDAPVAQPGSAGQDHRTGENIDILSWNRAEDVLDRLAKEDVAAVIMEAAMMNSGGIMPSDGYLQAVRDACTRHGTILIFDEVITGFRVGPGGAQAHFGVTPDLGIFAKAIANGFSVACVAGRADVMDHLSNGTILHGGTYNAQPMAMAATVATLDELSKQGVYESMDRVGRRLMGGIRDAFSDADLPVVVSGFPQIFNVAIGLNDAPVNYRSTLGVDRAAYRHITVALLERGVRALERGAWFLSAAHTEDIVDVTVAALRSAIEAAEPHLSHLRKR